MGFADDASALIEQKKFDELETLWMNQLDRDPSDAESFIRIGKALRKSEQRTQSDTLLGLLSDSLLERKLWPQRLAVLKELGRLSKHPQQLRAPIEQALRNAHGSHKSFARVFEFAGFNDAFVAKINSSGSALLYSTYLGGSGNDIGNGIAVDTPGNAYVTGFTFSLTTYCLISVRCCGERSTVAVCAAAI